MGFSFTLKCRVFLDQAEDEFLSHVPKGKMAQAKRLIEERNIQFVVNPNEQEYIIHFFNPESMRFVREIVSIVEKQKPS